MSSHTDTVHRQFDPQAQAYLQSAVHATGPDLVRARERVAQVPELAAARCLDLGTGAGHLSFALAPVVAQAVAADPSASMLATVMAAAAEKGLGNISTVQTRAESLPFPDAHFSLVASRYSAHHWLDLATALHEMRRVTQPGGYLLLIDIEGDENALADTHLQAIELLRDRSHVRDRSPSEWTRLLSAAGFDRIEHESWPTRLEFGSWVTRMRTPEHLVSVLRQLQAEAPREVQQALAIEADGSFSPRTGLWWARAA
ncbi:MAG: hypothetical protein RJA36_2866 [Pseudomonadota bacterium]|jgi:ubiquinone/menaquinone biosynthesis C-methylase UbiE